MENNNFFTLIISINSTLVGIFLTFITLIIVSTNDKKETIMNKLEEIYREMEIYLNISVVKKLEAHIKTYRKYFIINIIDLYKNHNYSFEKLIEIFPTLDKSDFDNNDLINKLFKKIINNKSEPPIILKHEKSLKEIKVDEEYFKDIFMNIYSKKHFIDANLFKLNSIKKITKVYLFSTILLFVFFFLGVILPLYNLKLDNELFFVFDYTVFNLDIKMPISKINFFSATNVIFFVFYFFNFILSFNIKKDIIDTNVKMNNRIKKVISTQFFKNFVTHY